MALSESYREKIYKKREEQWLNAKNQLDDLFDLKRRAEPDFWAKFLLH